jgi:hypothetical protein
VLRWERTEPFVVDEEECLVEQVPIHDHVIDDLVEFMLRMAW